MIEIYIYRLLTCQIDISHEQDCKDLGFDAVELNADFMQLDEENLLRLIRVVKNSGMKAKPEIGLGFQGGENAELSSSGNSLFH